MSSSFTALSISGVVRAVALDGMLVPVVHAAAGLTLRALARRVHELDGRIASRQLTTDDLMGGTFTIAGAPSAHTLVDDTDHHPARGSDSLGGCRPRGAGRRRGRRRRSKSADASCWVWLFDHRVCEPVAAASYLERVAELLAGLDLESER